MRRDFDIFENFSDGSTRCRATVRGRFEAQRKMDELSERSENQFYMLDIQEHFLLPTLWSPSSAKPSAKVLRAG
jgi:hypothetical protein